jgi:uncharacterized protein YegJ (DUF2314 family)
MRTSGLLIVLELMILAPASPALSQLTPNAPTDKPSSLAASQLAALDVAIAPYVTEARRTYPAARDRFLNGLPERNRFFVTVRLRDKDGRWEQSFIRVTSIRDGRIFGVISSQLRLVTSYAAGQRFECGENDILDWLIARPDGTEEGNLVGKFLDTYKAP